MTIFTPEDEHRIRAIHEKRAAEDKQLFFDYFCDKAVEEIADMIQFNKEKYIEQFSELAQKYSTRHTRSIPILEFKSVEELAGGRNQRKVLQKYYSEYEAAGSYYTSLSGLHVVDLSAIWRNSTFRQQMNEVLGSNMFSVKLTSKVSYTFEHVRLYENTLWLNIHI